MGADLFDHLDARRRFRVMANVEELERDLEYPWEKLAVFLNPAHRVLVERQYGGPALLPKGSRCQYPRALPDPAHRLPHLLSDLYAGRPPVGSRTVGRRLKYGGVGREDFRLQQAAAHHSDF